MVAIRIRAIIVQSLARQLALALCDAATEPWLSCLRRKIQPKPLKVGVRWAKVTTDSNSFPASLTVPVGQRIYAFGGVQGDLKLLRRLLLQIYCDTRMLAGAETTLILLGDVIDRADTPRLLISLARISNPRFRVLMGGSEALLAESLRPNSDVVSSSREGVLSTQDGNRTNTVDPDETIELSQPQIPADVLNWIERLPMSSPAGGYVFSAAGFAANPGDARQGLRNAVDGTLVDSQSRADGAFPQKSGAMEKSIPNRESVGPAGYSSVRRLSLMAFAFEGDKRRIIEITDGTSDFVMEEAERGSGLQIPLTPQDDDLIIEEIENLISAIVVAPDSDKRDRRSVTNGSASQIDQASVVGGFSVVPGSLAGWRTLPALAIFVVLAAVSLIRPFGSEIANRRARHDARITAVVNPAPAHIGVNSPPLDGSHSVTASVEASARPKDVRNRTKPKPRRRARPHRSMTLDGRKLLLGKVLTPHPAATKDIHLTGEALAKALAEDHLATQRLNNAELKSIQHRRVRRSIFRRRIKL